jgi:hypothetical protein
VARWQHDSGRRFRLRDDWAERLACYVSVTLAGIALALAICHVGI